MTVEDDIRACGHGNFSRFSFASFRDSMRVSCPSALGVCKRFLMISAIAALTTGCSLFDGKVEVQSANQNSRVSIIVLHHTAINFGRSLKVLVEPSSGPVSSHYLIPEPGDPSYPHNDLKVYQLVRETQRAWHAGRSYWRGKRGLNDQSIGIEIVNVPECYSLDDAGPEKPYVATERACFFPDFPGQQMELVEKLLLDILKRYPGISPMNIVAHSDIAPQRKNDPGPRFPWERLAKLGIGAWYDNATVVKYLKRLQTESLTTLQLQQALNDYGYQIEITGELDEQTRLVVSAFQMHFDRSNVSGSFTPGTVARLLALLEKYVPGKVPSFEPAKTDSATDHPAS